MSEVGRPLRILADSEVWQGSNAYAYVRAFRRMGHAVTVVNSEAFFVPGWQTPWLKAVRRLLEPAISREYERELVTVARRIEPHLFFAFKGPFVTRGALAQIKSMGAIAINVYPDVSVTAQGRWLPQTLPLYDWVFTTKTFGIADMQRLLGIENTSFMPHAYDPETHVPHALDDSDRQRYAADVAFIGTWSPKKERLLRHVVENLPEINLKIWGAQWEKAAPGLQQAITHKEVFGAEFAKCIAASRINLGLLSEARQDSSSGDLITSRTFHIPAAGGFMLHERTKEVVQYFKEGSECAFFEGEAELVSKIRTHLGNEQQRLKLLNAGRARSLASGYSIDARAEEVLAKYWQIRSSRASHDNADMLEPIAHSAQSG